MEEKGEIERKGRGGGGGGRGGRGWGPEGRVEREENKKEGEEREEGTERKMGNNRLPRGTICSLPGFRRRPVKRTKQHIVVVAQVLQK